MALVMEMLGVALGPGASASAGVGPRKLYERLCQLQVLRVPLDVVHICFIKVGVV